MDEVLKSIGKWFKERTTSPLYGTFLISLILWNWKLFYILFWQSEEKLTLPKIEYAQKYVLDVQDFWQHLSSFLILPAVSTFVIIWWLPYLGNFAHKKYLQFYYKRQLIVDQARIDYEKREKDNLSILSEVKKEQAVVKKEIEKNSTKEDLWKDELSIRVLNNPENISALNTARIAVYENGGRYTTDSTYQNTRYTNISPDHLSRLDVLGLIEIDENNRLITLTEKGKYFLLLLQDFESNLFK